MVNQNTCLNSNVSFQQYCDTYFACQYFNLLANNSGYVDPLTDFAQQAYHGSPGLDRYPTGSIMGPTHTVVGFSGDKGFVQTNHTDFFEAAHHHQELQSVPAASWPPVRRPDDTSSDGTGLMTAEKGGPRRVADHAATVVADSNAPAADACSWRREASSDDTRATSSVAGGGASSRPDAGSPDRADESLQLPRPMTGASNGNHTPGNNSPLVSLGIIGANAKVGS